VCDRVSPTTISAGTDLAAETQSPPSLQRQFARHTFFYSFAGAVTLLCNGILAFLLPRFLSIEDYGYYRLFVLYGVFAGAVHLGFLDGLLLRWASQPCRRIGPSLTPALKFIVVEHVLILTLLVGAAALLWGKSGFALACAVALYSVLWNWLSLGQYALEALRRFEVLSMFAVISPLLLLVSAVALNRLQVLTAAVLVLLCLLANCVAATAVWRYVRTHVTNRPRSALGALQLGMGHIRLGWSILGANLVANVLLSLDRIVLSARFSIRDFAIYSFAANALGLVYTMILSISRVVFPYLSQDVVGALRPRTYEVAETVLILVWSAGMAGYFPVAWVVSRWLPDYIPSLPLLRILMITTGMIASIQVLHNSYFRIARKQKRFLIATAIGLACACALLAAAAWSGELIAFAWAMVVCILVWWLASQWLLKDLVQQGILGIVRNLAMVAGCSIVFMFCSSRNNWTLGTTLYAVWMVFFTGSAIRSVSGHVNLPRVLLLFTGSSSNGVSN
jgi:O-antigen/teichoic acid export membrane protein